MSVNTKRFKLVFVFFILMNVAILTSARVRPQSKAAGEEDDGHHGVSIINGQPAAQGEFPYYTALIKGNGTINKDNFACGASLIAPDWVITARHCVKDNNLPRMVVVNLWRFDTEENTHQISLSKIKQIYKYAPDTVNPSGTDIALIQLKTPINDSITPPVVLYPKRLSTSQTKVTIIGLGNTIYDKESLPDQLQKAEIETQSGAYFPCNDPVFELKESKELCAGNFNLPYDEQRNANSGDSGGPLLVKDGAYWKQDALVSGGGYATSSVNNKKYLVEIYEELSSDAFKNWIQDTTKEAVTYHCQLKYKWDETYGYKYELESCEADGDWSNVAPYLVKEPLKDSICDYLVQFKQWVCDARNTPVYHYKTHFSVPAQGSPKIYDASAVVPLTELGN